MSAVEFRPSRGAHVEPDGSTTFSVWAPRVRRVDVKLVSGGRCIPLEPRPGGVFETRVTNVPAGTDYFLVLDGDRERPDPVSRFQPQGVHGPSRLVDPREFEWREPRWSAPAEIDAIYELHVGTFTPEGTFEAAISRLDALVELGVQAIEIMPVAEFPGKRNWGYDGVHLYAPQSSYGGPDGLKGLIDACHGRGLAVLLDVVYNHVGPEGNYLSDFGPYFSDRYRTPWGGSLNFDTAGSDDVRRHFVENALYWLAEFRVDGLRLDAVHAIYDFSADHVLAELGREFHALAARLEKRVVLVAESDLNDTRVTRPLAEGGWQLDAQWSDDFHHALIALVTGARHGYFADFGKVSDLAKAFEAGFVYDGRHSVFRRRRHGNSSAARPGAELCVFAQNHDQIANAWHGRRLAELVPIAAERLVAAVLAFAPNRILLFQGQEWGETNPFFYFTDHGDPELARAVREGRARELSEFGAADQFRDPQAEATFVASKLDWNRRSVSPHRELLEFHQKLLELRRCTPALADFDKVTTRAWADDGARSLSVARGQPGRRALLVASFADEPARVVLPIRARWQIAVWTAQGAPSDAESGALELPGQSAAILLESSDSTD